MLVSRNARDHCMNSALSKAVRLSDCSDHDTWNTHMPTWHNCWHKWRSPTSYFALSLMELDTTLLLHPFNGLFSRQAWVSRYQKGKTSLDLTEVRDDGVLGCSGISWTICKQSAPHSRQITTPTPHHSTFTGRMLFLMPNQQCQSTEGNCHFVPVAEKQYWQCAYCFLVNFIIWCFN